MMSDAAPPTAASMRTPRAMERLSTRPATLLNDPSARCTVDDVEKPETSSVLPVPASHRVTMGRVFTLKSKKAAVSPAMFEWKPKVWPPDRGVLVGSP